MAGHQEIADDSLVYRDAWLFLLAFAGECELIAVGILENGDRSPGLILRVLRKRHAFGFEYFGGSEDIIAPESDGLEFADALLVALRREEGEACFSPRNEQLNPSLGVRKRLVGDNLQSQRLGIEFQRYVLIADGNAYEFNASNHSFPPGNVRSIASRIQQCNQPFFAILLAGIAMLRLDNYVVDVLMRDLVRHDRRPASFLVYLWLAAEQGRRQGAVQVSYQELAESVGVSKSSAQAAVSWLIRRKLLVANKENATAIPRYTVRSPWRDAARRLNLRRNP